MTTKKTNKPSSNISEVLKQSLKTAPLIPLVPKDNVPVIKFIKNHKDAQAPTKAFETDMGWDMTAVSSEYDIESGCYVYNTGLRVEIPAGWGLLLFPRSSVNKKAMTLANSVGVIDSDYRGEVKFYYRPSFEPGHNMMNFTCLAHYMDAWARMRRRERKKKYNNSFTAFLEDKKFFNSVGRIFSDLHKTGYPKLYKPGERVGQALLVPNWLCKWVEVTELSSTDRGNGGFGSTGK